MAINISVVIPLYNKRETICRAVDSVRAQIASATSIVIVNDGSTDGSISKLVKYKDDNRIEVYTTSNFGVSAARNYGAQRCQTDYVAFLDADDYWHPNFLMEISEAIKKFPNKAIYCTDYSIYLSGQMLDSESKIENQTSCISDYINLLTSRNSIVSSSSVCLDRKIFNKQGGFDQNLRLFEDLDLWVRLSLISDIVYIPKVCAVYERGRENSACTLPPSLSDAAFPDKLTKLSLNSDFNTDQRKALFKLKNKYLYRLSFKALQIGDKTVAKHMLNKIEPESRIMFFETGVLKLLSNLPSFVMRNFLKFGKQAKLSILKIKNHPHRSISTGNTKK